MIALYYIALGLMMTIALIVLVVLLIVLKDLVLLLFKKTNKTDKKKKKDHCDISVSYSLGGLDEKDNKVNKD